MVVVVISDQMTTMTAQMRSIMADLLTLSDCMVHTFVQERLMTEIPDTLTLHYYCLHSSHATLP